jgi:hypothetical protein
MADRPREVENGRAGSLASVKRVYVTWLAFSHHADWVMQRALAAREQVQLSITQLMDRGDVALARVSF